MVAGDWEHVRETAEKADLEGLADVELEILHEKKGIDEGRYLFERASREFIADHFEEAKKLLEELIRIIRTLMELGATEVACWLN